MSLRRDTSAVQEHEKITAQVGPAVVAKDLMACSDLIAEGPFAGLLVYRDPLEDHAEKGVGGMWGGPHVPQTGDVSGSLLDIFLEALEKCDELVVNSSLDASPCWQFRLLRARAHDDEAVAECFVICN